MDFQMFPFVLPEVEKSTVDGNDDAPEMSIERSQTRDNFIKNAEQYARSGHAVLVQESINWASAIAPVQDDVIEKLQRLLNPAEKSGPERIFEERRYFSPSKRDELAKGGYALPDGSFPIVNREDLKNAIKAVGRAKNIERAKEHIKNRAKALGLMDMLPENWKSMAVARTIVPAWYAERYWERIAEFIGDREVLRQYDASNPIMRPAHLSSIQWNRMSPEERTLGAAVRRRQIHRNYEQCADDLRLAGWEVRNVVDGGREKSFTRIEDGKVVRAFLVRDKESTVWRARIAKTTMERAPEGTVRLGMEE